ncbi:CLUMA_CG019928, isoform A [Clunio marinus]|uniref:CLUMA_CG019928, isoform A n=1 Tax=Clunio marinus TaxID=568069 RepID=A0A1J1J258_9DIPT|nr:CLUMA_CG019928, isoform A [Clunio marinus]
MEERNVRGCSISDSLKSKTDLKLPLNEFIKINLLFLALNRKVFSFSPTNFHPRLRRKVA